VPSWQCRRGSAVVAVPSWQCRRVSAVVSVPSWQCRRGSAVVAAARRNRVTRSVIDAPTTRHASRNVDERGANTGDDVDFTVSLSAFAG
jgi:hypothetical protein